MADMLMWFTNCRLFYHIRSHRTWKWVKDDNPLTLKNPTLFCLLTDLTKTRKKFFWTVCSKKIFPKIDTINSYLMKAISPFYILLKAQIYLSTIEEGYMKKIRSSENYWVTKLVLIFTKSYPNTARNCHFEHRH